MSDPLMNRRQLEDLDNYITGHHGQDQLRDEAESVTEPCVDCMKRPGTEHCFFCVNDYCDRCIITHKCVDRQLEG